MDENNNKNQTVNILEIISVFLKYWPLIAISVVIALAVAFMYFKYASRTYRVYSRISINTAPINSNYGANAYLSVNDLMRQEKSFTNEITYLQSSPMIRSVIDGMNLFTTYYAKEDKIPKEFEFSLINIYKNSPFLVLVDDESKQPLNTLFYLNIINDDEYEIHADQPEARLYDIKTEEADKQNTYFLVDGRYNFGDVVTNGKCSFKILLNSNYNAEQYQGKDLFFRFNSKDALTGRFQEALSINSTFHESSIADLSLVWANEELAKDFLSKLIDTYIEKNLEKKNHNASNTLNYINQQLSNISGSLNQSERELQQYRASNDLMNIDDKTRTIYGQREELETSKSELENRLQYLTRLNNYFQSVKDSSTFIAPSFMGMSDATLATLIQELTTLSTERQNLISTNQLKNPRINTLDANINTIKKVIADNIRFNLEATRNELNEVNRRLSEVIGEFEQLPQTQTQLLGLERQFNINDAVYTTLLDRRIQAQIAMASNLPDCEIIEPVQFFEIASPNIKKIGVIALFIGVFIPSVYIIIVNFLSKKIRTKSELLRFTSLPLIGSIPRTKKNAINVVTNFPQAPITERFQSLRSNLIYYLLGKKNQSILVTSTLPNEGKSFISFNLALSFASTQNKTLLIELDLRKKTKILTHLQNKEQPGLSAYLIDQAKYEDIIVKTEHENLDFLQSGEIPPNPISLLSTERLKDLFVKLKEKYDYIIIDTPPFGLVSDPFLLMEFADMNLYVSRLGIITKAAFKQNMEDIKDKKIENIYLLQNDITKVDRSYYYKYSYEDKKRGFFSRFKLGPA